MGKKKNEYGIKSGHFWLHIAIHLITLTILLWDWNLWPVVIWVTLIYSRQIQLFCSTASEIVNDQKLWGLFLAYLVLSTPSSVIIGKMTQSWSEDMGISTGSKGLKNAGKWIGIMERLLIFTFIVINEFSAIGFLLAAKSVFRFGDLKDTSDHKKTEYIIIGTFMSFSIAIAIGLYYKLNLF